jgi:hypothetical protein
MCKKTVVAYFRTPFHVCLQELRNIPVTLGQICRSPGQDPKGTLHSKIWKHCFVNHLAQQPCHTSLLRRLWPMFKRWASYPFQNMCTCSPCSRRDAIPSSCAQMYPPARDFTLELNNILYPVFVSNFLFPFIHCSFLHYFLLFALLSFLLSDLLKDAASC